MTGNKPHSTETILIVKGRVQGVFFRAKTKKHADNLGLKGYVKNLSDGTVEICITGEEVDALVTRLKKEPLPVQINEITRKARPSTCNYEDFRSIT